MEELKTCSLSSGSSGNSIYIGYGETHILIDAGRTAKALTDLLAGIGVPIGKLSAVFITHEHIDHVSALRVLISKIKIPVYMVWESYNSLGDDYKDALGGVINFIKPEVPINIGDLTVECYPVMHDSAANVGYIIHHGENKAVGIATDVGYMTKQVIESVCGCKILYIESNHDLEMLKRSSYPHYLKNRIKSKNGHLSNKDCAESLPYFINHGAEKIILYHLSGENNSKEIAVNEAKRSILSAKLNAGTVHLGVAPKSEPSKMITMKFEQRIHTVKTTKTVKTAQIESGAPLKLTPAKLNLKSRELPEVEF